MDFHFNDIKVIGVNAICMAILQMKEINLGLQTALFLVTIIYTIIRIVNELKKYGSAKEEKEEDIKSH